MGPKASTPVTEDQTIKINHPIFTVIQLVRGQQDEQLIRTQIRLANRKQFDSWKKRADDVPANDSLMLPIKSEYKEQGLCGNSGVAIITYDNFPYLLSDQITNRECLNKKLFEENELWYLVYTLLSAAFTYHRQGLKVGDMRPDNIFINEDGQVKVASVDSWPGQQTNYSKSFYEKQVTYLSPEEIKDYQFGKLEQSTDKELSETFSIGLTCLDAATLSESKSLYSKNFKFNYEKLDMRIQEFKKYGYSELLTLTIENMCQVDTEFRSSSREILQWLLPHEEAIINLEEFEVNGLPQKMKLAKDRQRISNQSNNISSIHSHNQSMTSQYPGSAFVQPSNYSVPSGISLPTYVQGPPVQFTHYAPQVIYPIKPSVQPSISFNPQPLPTYQLPSIPQYPQTLQQPINGYYVANSSTLNSIGSNGIQPGQQKFALDKLQQQLEESRKNFPQ